MGIGLPLMSHTKQIIRRSLFALAVATNVPKGHCTVYIGKIQKKRFVVPISYLNQEEFGFNHPAGGITIPCKEETFLNLTGHLNKE
ncbi:hypothetical protein GIB67_007566 [Kingdonia uniflora]|uniref:Small auxin up regulated protein n=1 Tax=Kingdonia uniflora TaxID=39325 RepID=A0A7J7LN56_9MAGN|nr:hypothetical protein GIB67_007566 [Kingdonia uniflora]